MCQSLFLDEVAASQTATLIKMRLWHMSFFVNFTKVLRIPLLQKICYNTASVTRFASQELSKKFSQLNYQFS